MSNVITLLCSTAPRSTILIRMAVGAIFFSEGIQKFLYTAQLGAGRFAKIGLPSPETLAPLVGCFEILCGLAVLLGAFTRLAAVPLIAIMLVAISSTKLPLLAKSGFWTMAHESRTDFAMLLGSAFLAISGAGPISVDQRLASRSRRR